VKGNRKVNNLCIKRHVQRHTSMDTSYVTLHTLFTSHVTLHTSHDFERRNHPESSVRNVLLKFESEVGRNVRVQGVLCFVFFHGTCGSNCARWVIHLQAWVSCIHQALKEMKVTVLRVTSFGVDLFHLLSSLLLLSCNIVHSLLTPNFKRIDYSYPKNRRWPRGKKMKKNRGN
jgi:hypothetical protein